MKNVLAIPGLLALMCLLCFWQNANAQAPRFKTVAEKEAWAAQHPEAQAPAAKVSASQPSDAPVYRDTGHPDADQAAYRSAKEAYARKLEAAHPAPAAGQNASKPVTPRTEEANAKKALKSTETAAPAPTAVAPASRSAVVRPTSGLPAGHPIYKDTGNPEADEATYARAKAAYHAEKAAQEKAAQADPDAAARAEKEKYLAEEAQRVRLAEQEEARKKAADQSNNSDR